MKKLTLFILLFSIKAFSLNCYIIDEKKIEFRSRPEVGRLNEPCPVNDLKLKIQEIVYLKLKATACVGEADCRSKIENLCEEIAVDGIKTIIGRPIINQDFTEAYCTKPQFSQAKRDQFLSEEQAKLDLINTNITKKNIRLDNLKTMYVQFCSSPTTQLNIILCALVKDLLIRHNREVE